MEHDFALSFTAVRGDDTLKNRLQRIAGLLQTVFTPQSGDTREERHDISYLGTDWEERTMRCCLLLTERILDEMTIRSSGTTLSSYSPK